MFVRARRFVSLRVSATRFFGSASDKDEAIAFIVERGYRKPLAVGMIAALEDPSSGISKGHLLKTVTSMAGRWEVGEDAGLDALASAVDAEILRTEGKEEVTVHVTSPNGTKFDVIALEGLSLYDVVHNSQGKGAEVLQEFIECACSGVMACSTCHVIVQPAWFKKVGEPCEAEQDMIDLAFEPTDTSRLGCQLVLSKELDGLEISIPRDANNLMDPIPFQDR